MLFNSDDSVFKGFWALEVIIIRGNDSDFVPKKYAMFICYYFHIQIFYILKGKTLCAHSHNRHWIKPQKPLSQPLLFPLSWLKFLDYAVMFCCSSLQHIPCFISFLMCLFFFLIYFSSPFTKLFFFFFLLLLLMQDIFLHPILI